MIKIKAWEDSKEVLIPISQITNSVQRARETFEVTQSLRDNRIITLQEHPLSLGETVILNGMILTEGSTYDYTISLNVITFNIGIVPKNGHVLINYVFE